MLKEVCPRVMKQVRSRRQTTLSDTTYLYWVTHIFAFALALTCICDVEVHDVCPDTFEKGGLVKGIYQTLYRFCVCQYYPPISSLICCSYSINLRIGNDLSLSVQLNLTSPEPLGDEEACDKRIDLKTPPLPV